MFILHIFCVMKTAQSVSHLCGCVTGMELHIKWGALSTKYETHHFIGAWVPADLNKLIEKCRRYTFSMLIRTVWRFSPNAVPLHHLPCPPNKLLTNHLLCPTNTTHADSLTRFMTTMVLISSFFMFCSKNSQVIGHFQHEDTTFLCLQTVVMKTSTYCIQRLSSGKKIPANLILTGNVCHLCAGIQAHKGDYFPLYLVIKKYFPIYS